MLILLIERVSSPAWRARPNQESRHPFFITISSDPAIFPMFISLKILPPSYQHGSLRQKLPEHEPSGGRTSFETQQPQSLHFIHSRSSNFFPTFRICKKHQVEPLSWRRWFPIYTVFKVLYKMCKSEQHPSNQSPSELLYHAEHKVRIPRSSSFHVRRLQVPSRFSQVTGTTLLFYCCSNYYNQGKW